MNQSPGGRKTHRPTKKKARTGWSAPSSLIRVYLQPEHDAQHSADAQHDVCAAFTVLVSPSAITAINSATFNIFIVFSFKKWKELYQADATVRTRKIQFTWACRFL